MILPAIVITINGAQIPMLANPLAIDTKFTSVEKPTAIANTAYSIHVFADCRVERLSGAAR